MELLHQSLTDRIIKVYYDVYNELGYGFLEKVYHNALLIELRLQGFDVVSQKKIDVYYKSEGVGVYYADIVVNDIIILEIKAAEFLAKDFEYQLVNYLRATTMEVGLLLNFGPKPEFRRKVFENSRKRLRSM